VIEAAPTARRAEPRVAIVHEWLVKYAGSERCVREMRREFPESRLLTTLVASDGDHPAEFRGAEASCLQYLPGAPRAYQWLIPVMPLSWAVRRPVDDVDLVISSSHACAKGVRVAPGIPHLCYCHTPMRYAWDFDAERTRFPTAVRPAARASAAALRHWDRRSAHRVTRFLANSTAVAERIRRVYGREADVVHPPVDTEFFTPGGERSDDFLYVGRFVAYKRPDLVVEAFRGLEERLIMVGEGHMEQQLRAAAGPNVSFERDVSSERLRDLYRGARALVYPAEEDFGITMAEAQACGTPVIGLRAGGAIDIVRDGETGFLTDTASPETVRALIRRAASTQLDEDHITASAQRFSAEIFRSRIRAAVEQLLVPAPARGQSR
jgi:glycosyltransferase involved in cell wall biosynthesis